MKKALVELQMPVASDVDFDYGLAVRDLLDRTNAKIAVIDDDPTGIQTAHDCPLITSWDNNTVTKALESKARLFYVLTNSRSVSENEAVKRQREAVSAIVRANRISGRTLHFVSRSDSTLRGHFPAEPECLRETLQNEGISLALPTLFIPAFFEAGRHTVNDVHYVLSGDELVPAAQTEFANDSVFAYRSSNLGDYIIEKSRNSLLRSEIASVDIGDIRTQEVSWLTKCIEKHADKRYLIANVYNYHDLRKISFAALLRAESLGESLVVRSSSSLVKALSGLKDKPQLTPEELMAHNTLEPGLVVVGSHVDKTSRQLAHLLDIKGTKGIEIDVSKFLCKSGPDISVIQRRAGEAVAAGLTPVIFTSRTEIRPESEDDRLALGTRISCFLSSLISSLTWRPSFIISKGGITSHDVLSRGLNVATATVKGQVIPGVPAVEMTEEHRWPGLPLIIFPGNVGDDMAVAEVFRLLSHQDEK